MTEGRRHLISARSALGVLWRSLVTGLGYTLFTTIGGMVAQALGLPLPEVAGGMDPMQALLGTFLAGLVVGLTLGPLATRLPLPTLQRAVLLFGVIFMLNSLISVMEALFFTTIPVGEHLYSLMASAVGHAGLGVLLALLFRAPSADQGLASALRAFLGRRRWAAWAWRFGLAGLLYLPAYFLFGMLIYPLVRAYYEDPSLGLRLAVPGFEVIFPLEILRGLLIVLTVFPLVAVLRRSRLCTAFWLAVTIAVLGAVTPMLQASFFPLTMRLVHGLEIMADSILHALAIAWLLGWPEGEAGKASAPMAGKEASV
jgi:hypothetical protein